MRPATTAYSNVSIPDSSLMKLLIIFMVRCSPWSLGCCRFRPEVGPWDCTKNEGVISGGPELIAPADHGDISSAGRNRSNGCAASRTSVPFWLVLIQGLSKLLKRIPLTLPVKIRTSTPEGLANCCSGLTLLAREQLCQGQSSVERILLRPCFKGSRRTATEENAFRSAGSSMFIGCET